MKSLLALFAVTVLCLVAPVAFAQTADTVIAPHDSNAYTIGYYENANMGLPDAQLHVTNPGSTGGFEGQGGAFGGGDLCANIYVFTPDQQLAECCSCPVSPNGMQGFSLATNLTTNPLTSTVQHNGAIKIVSSFGGGKYPAGLPPVSIANTNYTPPACDATTNFYPYGRLESWITHVRTLGTSLGAAFTVTEISLEPVDLSYSELKKLQQECFALIQLGSTAGACTCDPAKRF